MSYFALPLQHIAEHHRCETKQHDTKHIRAIQFRGLTILYTAILYHAFAIDCTSLLFLCIPSRDNSTHRHSQAVHRLTWLHLCCSPQYNTIPLLRFSLLRCASAIPYFTKQCPRVSTQRPTSPYHSRTTHFFAFATTRQTMPFRHIAIPYLTVLFPRASLHCFTVPLLYQARLSYSVAISSQVKRPLPLLRH